MPRNQRYDYPKMQKMSDDELAGRVLHAATCQSPGCDLCFDHDTDTRENIINYYRAAVRLAQAYRREKAKQSG